MIRKFRIYVSAPVEANLFPYQKVLFDGIIEKLIHAGFDPRNISFSPPGQFTNPGSKAIPQTFEGMHQLMRKCQGAVILAFAQRRVCDENGNLLGFSPTEYNHFEGALAIAQGLPLLLLAEDIVLPRGIAARWGGQLVVNMPQQARRNWLNTDAFIRPYATWCAEVNTHRDVFLGYCSAATSVASEIRAFLEAQGVHVLDWQRDFTPGGTVLEQIEEAGRLCTCGVFLFTKDDTLAAGNQKHAAPRDNVIFEAGYFMHAKGKERTLIIRESKTKLPADVGGNLYLQLENRFDISTITGGLNKFIEAAL